MLPLGTQVLNTDKKGKESIVRKAECPLHKKQTHAETGFLGAGEGESGKVWLFRCTALKVDGNKADHVFAARVPRGVPETMAEVLTWMTEQRLNRLKVLSKSQS